MNKKHLLIVFHSQSGRAQQLAFSCFFGAGQEPEIDVRLRRAVDASFKDLQWSDGLVMVTPENFGAISGGMKEFLDSVY